MLWGKVLTAEKGRYNIMAASRREVGEAVVARKVGKGKPTQFKEKEKAKEEEGKEGIIFIVTMSYVWWDVVGARRGRSKENC
jgi:hypothetical protein